MLSGDQDLPDGIGMARLAWTRLPTAEGAAAPLPEGSPGAASTSAGQDELFVGAVESLDYEIIENYAYREEQAQRSKFWVPYYIMLKWVFALLIGVGTGLAAIFINLAVENFSGWKFTLTFAIIQHSYFVGFLVYILLNLALVFSSVYIVTQFAPAAAGSGIPEIKGYLNGVDTHGILLFRTLVGKIFGSIGSVGGGLALGKEGPLVHTGACIASLLGQGGSAKYHLNSRWVQIFESDRDRRDLVTCGCAAGVAAAFRAPVGGVLFALEEVTSWWRSHLMWRVFFTSAVVAVVVRSAMNWCNSGKCGHFGAGGFIIWDISGGQEDYSYQELLPVAIIGVIGGLLGAQEVNMEEHEVNMEAEVNMEEHEVNLEQEVVNMTGVGAQQAKKTRKTLSDTQKYAAYVALHALCMKGGGKFDKEDKKNIAKIFEVDIRQIQSLWQRAMKQIEEGLPVDVSSRRKGRCGRKPLEIDLSRIPSIPLNKRSTIRSLAWQLGVNPTTLFRKFEMKLIRRHSNALTPPLTEKHKRNRAQFCLGMVDEDTIATADPLFNDMYRFVHVDEKWFNMTVHDKVYYLLPDEPDPKRAVAGNCIGKVMFLTAVARPRYDSEGNMTFDGKLGMWPFVKEVPAQRRSQNREKGTLETKNLVVTREVMREYFIEKLLPAIELLWPQEDVGKTIFIQQDNAKPHLLPNDPEFAEAVANSRFKIKLMQQPANSPDLNVLDLGFFRSIQSLTNTLSSKTLKEFIKGVEAEFRAYESSKLNRIFLTLMSVMVEVINNAGENGLKIVHANKERLERLGHLPIRLRCPPEAIAHTLNFLGQAQDVA